MTHRMRKTVHQGRKEERYAFMDALPQFVWLIQPDGSLIYTNQHWRDYSHLLSQHAGEQKGSACQQELAAKQSMMPYEKAYVWKDGDRLPVLVGRVTVEHHPHQAIGFMLDNSARRELEQRKGAFLGIVSHELKTPLASSQDEVPEAERRKSNG